MVEIIDVDFQKQVVIRRYIESFIPCQRGKDNGFMPEENNRSNLYSFWDYPYESLTGMGIWYEDKIDE